VLTCAPGPRAPGRGGCEERKREKKRPCATCPTAWGKLKLVRSEGNGGGGGHMNPVQMSSGLLAWVGLQRVPRGPTSHTGKLFGLRNPRAPIPSRPFWPGPSSAPATGARRPGTFGRLPQRRGGRPHWLRLGLACDPRRRPARPSVARAQRQRSPKQRGYPRRWTAPGRGPPGPWPRLKPPSSCAPLRKGRSPLLPSPRPLPVARRSPRFHLPAPVVVAGRCVRSPCLRANPPEDAFPESTI